MSRDFNRVCFFRAKDWNSSGNDELKMEFTVEKVLPMHQLVSEYFIRLLSGWHFVLNRFVVAWVGNVFWNCDCYCECFAILCWNHFYYSKKLIKYSNKRKDVSWSEKKDFQFNFFYNYVIFQSESRIFQCYVVFCVCKTFK